MTLPFPHQTDAFGFSPAFAVDEPTRHTLPFVFNTGHSGSVYPDSFLKASRLDALSLRRSEDAHVDRLFAQVVELGAPLLRCNFPRAYLDVNREPYELDPRMFEGRLPPFANTRSMRVAGGLGTVPRVVSDGQEIYAARMPVDEAVARIDGLYKPYHRALRGLILRTVREFGRCMLIDCHSMPSSSLGRDHDARADFVLGDRFGTACDPALIDAFEAAFRARGYKVVRNKPYAGGFITEHYGEPNIGRHALQIEINRALYMNEASLAITPGFFDLAKTLGEAIVEVADDLGSETPIGIAAE
ncbi:N-formylglutamate amidohydrolase [Methylobacterium sp. HMF5984]|uniref:N-formylglutamate amidohydrolase n=1 Tax=unclassified Methylobacterium TaxID=2615210 RepID=UPI0011CA394E|nr:MULTISPECIES: N-formylglutamate amidohydrolase [unclassified Methylobacterium]MCJ2112110.1 N-formylglutamate amidohydrolase [Methylobacterium sp. E-025]TXN71803.1 N-formylglutamate amidohydrolase [Methylobacterium sp. WL6]